MALMQPHPHLFPEGPRPLHPWGSLGLAQAWQLGRRARGEGKMCRGGGVLKPLLLASRNHGAPTSKQSSAPRVTGSFRPSRERPGGILRLPSVQVRAETPQRLLLLQSSVVLNSAPFSPPPDPGSSQQGSAQSDQAI